MCVSADGLIIKYNENQPYDFSNLFGTPFGKMAWGVSDPQEVIRQPSHLSGPGGRE